MQYRNNKKIKISKNKKKTKLKTGLKKSLSADINNPPLPYLHHEHISHNLTVLKASP
jgi:hypothetical protein